MKGRRLEELSEDVLLGEPGDGSGGADFVENDETAIGGVVDDERGFVHFDHEGRLALREVIAGADSCKDSID